MSTHAKNKHITLMRHGESDPSFDGRDFDRPLTENGILFCQHQREIISSLPPVDFALCSGAKRTRQTLDCLSLALNHSAQIVFDDHLFLAPTKYLINTIEQFNDAHSHALLVGHGPTLSGMIRWLIDDQKTPAGLIFHSGEIKHAELNIHKWMDLYPGCAL